MSSGDGLDLLIPFLPGLESALDDPDVSEIMINGPGNVWLEGHGRLRPIDAPALDAAALERAAIHIARPLGLDPATTPVLDARLGDGSRVAICVAAGPARPVAITVRRFGTRSFSAAQLVEQGALPETHPARGRADPPHAPQHPRQRRHRERQDHAAQCPHCPHPRRRADRRHRRHVGAADRRPELRPVRGARAAAGRRLRSATWCVTRCGTARIILSSAKCAAAKPPTCCKPSTPATAARSPPSTPTTPRAPSRGWRAARCRAAAIFRGRSRAGASWTGSPLVIHMTRADGRRFVEEAAYVRGYDAGSNVWQIEQLDRTSL